VKKKKRFFEMFSSCFSAGTDSEPSVSDSESEKEPEDEREKQLKKIEQAKDVFKDKMKELDKLFKNNHKLLDAKLKPVTDLKSKGPIFGPSKDSRAQGIEEIVYAKSISIYPKKPRKEGDDKSAGRLGDPVCDAYCFDIIGEGKAFISVADGCNWGPKPLEASRLATTTFQEAARKNYSKFSTVRETGRLLLRSFLDAHTKILEAPLGRGVNDIWETGTTTLCGGVLLELDEEDAKKANAPYIFIVASIGDCKAFHISSLNGQVTDITTGTRPPSAITNVNDPGGRLGPYVGKEGSADLRNLSVFTQLCHENDILLLVSDGVYDNFDAQQLGISVEEAKLDFPSWEQADAHAAEKAKDNYRTQLLGKKLMELANTNDADSDDDKKGKKKKKKGDDSKPDLAKLDLQQFANVLLHHAKTVTKYSRKWMQEHPTARMPDARSKKRDPSMLGKMDHTTCLVFRVGYSQ